MSRCVVCGKSYPGGTGHWAYMPGYDTTPVCKGSCWRKYTATQTGIYLHQHRGGVFGAIDKERVRQEKLWGEGPMPVGKELSILVEEVGEVASALQGDGVLSDELEQVGAVCARWLEFLKKG